MEYEYFQGSDTNFRVPRGQEEDYTILAKDAREFVEWLDMERPNKLGDKVVMINGSYHAKRYGFIAGIWGNQYWIIFGKDYAGGYFSKGEVCYSNSFRQYEWTQEELEEST